jgi:CRISPR-associated endonuclease/helicase Cas3
MKVPNYERFFAVATVGNTPFDYQCRLACGERDIRSEEQWLASGTPAASRLIKIPTGCGKTAAVILAWFWNRIILNNNGWPRRLAYCLPMRTLVEQTAVEVQRWLANLIAKASEFELNEITIRKIGWLQTHSPVILMGGEEPVPQKRDWDIHPEHEVILIGTQDMLLSRALNRGYAMSRYRWPMHFGLLNNDCLWVMDETQLMGVGVETSAQLNGFRGSGKLASIMCPTWWMSATLDTLQLETADHPRPAEPWPVITLTKRDLEIETVAKRHGASKPLALAPVTLEPATKKDYAKNLTEFVLEKHRAGTLTLVIVDRVARAQDLYQRFRKKVSPERLALIHSRFRPVDRGRHEALLTGEGDRIVVATQAVEAGVDVSARLLVTELAPWSSMVQRFGRCNRRGEFRSDAEVFWIDVKPKDDKDDLALPYDTTSLATARAALKDLSEAGPHAVEKIAVPVDRIIRPVLRRKDLIDLFDTSPDICGYDLDVSRYIRDGEDSDVQVFWRELANGEPGPDTAAPIRAELCRVSIGDFTKFLKAKATAWTWNALEERWQKVERPHPGTIYLVAVKSGGYSAELGWTGDAKHTPAALSTPTSELEGYGQNGQTFIGRWVELHEHTVDVVNEVEQIASSLGLNSATELRTAALWHDVGKAHTVFQDMLTHYAQPPYGDTFWAKSAKQGGRSERPGFRHELASALAWLQHAPEDVADRNLVAFLIAAHHGKVRLSIRSLPNEDPPGADGERLYARGVWDGDDLPAIAFDGLNVPATKLDLSFMQMGDGPRGPSWLARMITLRERIGPFRLALLETILRVADARASAAEASKP